MNKKYLYIGFAALFGTSLRAGIGVLMKGISFPYSTLIINIIASFSLVILYRYVKQSGFLPEITVAAIGTGLIGSFSTMSAVAYDTSFFILNNQLAEAVLNYSANMLLCLLAALAGLAYSQVLIKLDKECKVQS